MSIEKHKHWYFPLHIRNLSNLFACEFISPDSLLEDLWVGSRKQTPNFFQKDEAGLCLFDRPFRPQKFKDELRDLVWVKVDASYIKSMGSDDEIKFYSTGFDALSISFPLIINSKDFRFLFPDTKAIEKLKRLVKANHASKLIGKYLKRFSTLQSGKDSAGIELKEFEENTFRSPDTNSERHKEKIREIDTGKGIYYAILLSKELSCDLIERKISSTLSRLRSLLSSINTERQMSGETFGPKLLSLFNEIMAVTRLVGLHECSEQLLSSDEFCGKFSKLNEDRNLVDPTLAEVLLYKSSIDFSPFKKRLMDCHCEIISKKSYESAISDCKEELRKLVLSLEGRRYERISSLRSIGFRYDGNPAGSLLEDGDESELFDKILSVLKELKDPQKRKVDIDDIIKILTGLLNATKGDDKNFVQEILDSKEEGKPLSQPIEATPPLLNFLHFLDFIGDLSGLETFINNMDDPPPHSYMAFAYWGAFNGFARMDESFAAPLFENLSVSLLSNIDRDIFRHHRPSPEKKPEPGQNSSRAKQSDFPF